MDIEQNNRCYDKRFESLLEGMRMQRPDVIERMVRWYPVSRYEVVVITDDGCKWVYHELLHTVRKLYDPRKHNMTDVEDYEYIPSDELEWRREFSMRLRKIMLGTNLTQEMLSEQTGISRTTLSKYMQGKATPSAYNLTKILRVLGCTEAELLYFNR